MRPADDPSGVDAKRGVLAGLYAVLIVAAWTLLRGIYRPENIDDAWYLSIAYSYLHFGDPGDPVFGGNTGGVQLAGKTFAYLWGFVLDRAGWTKSAAHAVSTVVMLVGAALWWWVARCVLPGRFPAIAFLLLLVVCEPFFAAANQARPDTLTFTLIAATVYCVVTDRFFPAGLLAALAFESHPAGILALWLGGAVLVGRRLGGRAPAAGWRRSGLLALAGLVLGAAIYLALHGRHLAAYSPTVRQNLVAGNFLWEYFFETKYRRHLPELVLLLAAVGVRLARRDLRDRPVVTALLVAALLAPAVFPRPNFHYAVLVYPCFLLFLVDAAVRLRVLVPLLALVWVLLAPQYAFVWKKNRGHDFPAYVAALRTAVPDDDRPVLGRPNAWFAFPERRFFAYDYGRDFTALGIPEIWWIEEPTWQGSAAPRLREAMEITYEEAEPARLLEVPGTEATLHRLRRVTLPALPGPGRS